MDTKMANMINHIDKVFENKYRFSIMNVIIKRELINYSSLQNLFLLSSGALSYHLNILENARYIIAEKKFIDKKPNTSYSCTTSGKKSFTEYKKALTLLINM